MHSPFANLFDAILTRIAAEVPSIRYIDQELGQLKKARAPVSWPCLLIDFEDFHFDDLSEHVQMAKGIVTLQLGFAPYSPTAQSAPLENREQALGYYDIEWHLHKAIHGWQPGDEYGSFCRIAATTQRRSDNYRVREIRYSIAFEDYSTKRSLRYVPAEVVVTEQIGV